MVAVDRGHRHASTNSSVVNIWLSAVVPCDAAEVHDACKRELDSPVQADGDAETDEADEAHVVGASGSHACIDELARGTPQLSYRLLLRPAAEQSGPEAPSAQRCARDEAMPGVTGFEAKELPEAAGPEAHITILRGQPLAAAGGASGALSDEREGDSATASAPDPPRKRPKKNKAQRLMVQAARDAARDALQADIRTFDRESRRLRWGREGDASRLWALRVGIQAQMVATTNAEQASLEAVTDAAAESARTAFVSYERSLKTMVDTLMAAFAEASDASQ